MDELVYWGDWEKGGKAAMMLDFDIPTLTNVTILAAAYYYKDYAGNAYVLFKKDNILYTIYGGHCSCFGLEGQWHPEEVTEVDLTFVWRGFPSEFADRVKSIITREMPPQPRDLMAELAHCLRPEEGTP